MLTLAPLLLNFASSGNQLMGLALVDNIIDTGENVACTGQAFKDVQATCWTTNNDAKTGFCCTTSRSKSPRGVWKGLTKSDETPEYKSHGNSDTTIPPNKNQMHLCKEAFQCKDTGLVKGAKCTDDTDCASDGQEDGGCDSTTYTSDKTCGGPANSPYA